MKSWCGWICRSDPKQVDALDTVFTPQGHWSCKRPGETKVWCETRTHRESFTTAPSSSESSTTSSQSDARPTRLINLVKAESSSIHLTPVINRTPPQSRVKPPSPPPPRSPVVLKELPSLSGVKTDSQTSSSPKTPLKSALKKDQGAARSSNSVHSSVILTGVAASTLPVAKNSNVMGPQSFWDPTSNVVGTDNGFAVYVGSATEKARTSVIYSQQSSPLRALLSARKDRKYEPVKLNDPTAAATTPVEHSAPSTAMLQPHPFHIPRVRSPKNPNEADSHVTVESIRGQKQLASFDECTSILESSPKYSKLSPILTRMESTLRTEGVAIRVIVGHKPSFDGQEARLFYSGDTLVIVKDDLDTGEALTNRDSIVQLYTWQSICREPYLHSQLMNAKFDSLAREEVDQLCLLQYQEDVYVRNVWFLCNDGVGLSLMTKIS